MNEKTGLKPAETVIALALVLVLVVAAGFVLAAALAAWVEFFCLLSGRC